MRIVSCATQKCNTQLLKIELKWESLETRRKNHTLVMLYKIMFNDGPVSLKNRFENLYNIKHNVHGQRHSENIRIPLCKTKLYKQSFFPFWNRHMEQIIKRYEN